VTTGNAKKPPVLGRALLGELADLALVPTDKRDFFISGVCYYVKKARELAGLVSSGLKSKKAPILLRAAITLNEGLGSLNKDEHKIIALGGRKIMIGISPIAVRRPRVGDAVAAPSGSPAPSSRCT
jgi:hypothetical protein